MASPNTLPKKVTIEYDCRNKRLTKTFDNPWEARRFWIAKDTLGKNPKILKEK